MNIVFNIIIGVCIYGLFRNGLDILIEDLSGPFKFKHKEE